ncbi:MAG: hypothetical protein V3S17_02085 [candidate division Zixibacteria bacterium]
MKQSSSATKYTSMLIYIGTFLISLLSFFTTYYGLALFLDKWLALLGSLGLQSAMLGIAWNLMRLRENRAAYVMVFSVAATFSIFFSYVNFNTGLKGNVRALEARDAYVTEARPILRQYAFLAKQALSRGGYQSQRLADLLEMEKDHGWATVVDEGSNDPFIQSIIEGARRTVISWKNNQGTDYHQGVGQGIITNYLTSWTDQVEHNLTALKKYVKTVDSLSLKLGSQMPVAEQYNLVNLAAVSFPLAEHEMMTGTQANLSEPPFTADFIESPANKQQAMDLVISDLYLMDHLTFFSLFFAIVIDLIVIVMALCTSQAVDAVEYVFSRVERDASRRLRKISLDDPQEFTRSLESNLERLRQTSEYSRNLEEVLNEFRTKERAIRLVRDEEQSETHQDF